VVPGAPAHDAHSARPTSPQSLPPEAMARELELARFDQEHRFAVAVLESPGRLPSAADAIADVAKALQARFALGSIAVLGEREGAVAASLCVRKHPGLVRALGLVAGVTIGPELFTGPAAPRGLAVPATGHASTENLSRLRKGAPAPALTWLDDAGARPWPIAVGLEARALADFVVFATRD
jgi:pimeloyl-ACP methyl ester carboxylesterase